MRATCPSPWARSPPKWGGASWVPVASGSGSGGCSTSPAGLAGGLEVVDHGGVTPPGMGDQCQALVDAAGRLFRPAADAENAGAAGGGNALLQNQHGVAMIEIEADAAHAQDEDEGRFVHRS